MGSAIESSQPSGRYTFRNVVSYHGDSNVRRVRSYLGLSALMMMMMTRIIIEVAAFPQPHKTLTLCSISFRDCFFFGGL